jgi:hypothetical protein
MLSARLRAGPSGKRRGDDGQPGRGGERRGHPLDQARADEQAAAADQAAEQRGDREHGEGRQEDPAASKQVGRAPAEEQQAPVAKHVAAGSSSTDWCSGPCATWTAGASTCA